MRDLGFLGFITLEDTMRLALQCRNGSHVNTAPDAAPTWKVFGTDDTAILTGSLGAADADSLTGFRTGDAAITAANGFASGGRYIIRFFYEISTTDYSAVGTFSVL